MVETEIKFKTLTPIWTGDANKKCTAIKDTSIIGSMRWWYEAIIRGAGGYACDPSNGGCEFDTKGYEKALKNAKSIDEALEIGLKNVCPVCRLFGCTGWKRRFRLEVEDISTNRLHFVNHLESINCDWWIYNPKSYGRNAKAFYSSEILNLKLSSESKKVENKIISLLKVIEEIGALGAKSQNGFGIIEIIQENKIQKLEIDSEISSYLPISPDKLIPNGFRNSSAFYRFSVKIKSLDEMLKNFKDHRNEEFPILTGFTIKYYLRKKIKDLDVKEISNLVKNFTEIKSQMRGKYPSDKFNNISKIVARTLFGSDLGDDKRKWASLIEISDIFEKNGKYQYRVVCFLPKSVNYDGINIEFNISEVLDKVQNILMSAFGKSVEIDETWSGKEILDTFCEC